jgi:hypothetical protein
MAFANLSIAPLRSIIAGQFVCSNRLLRCGQKMAYSAKVSVKCCARNRYRRHSDRRRPALRGDRVRLETVDVAAVVLRGGVGELLWTGDGSGGGAEGREVRGGDQAGETSGGGLDPLAAIQVVETGHGAVDSGRPAAGRD